MPYCIITAPKMPTGDTPQERLQGRIQKGRILLEAAGRLFEQGGMVLDQFLYPYVDRVILDGGGCLKGIISLGDRMLVEAPAGLNRDFLGHETGLTVHIVEKRPDFSSFFGEETSISSVSPWDPPTAIVSWDGRNLPDGWKDYELRRFCKRWQAFVEMAKRQIRSGGGRMELAEGQILLVSLPPAGLGGECTAIEQQKEKIASIYRSQMDPIFPQGAPPLLWTEGMPVFGK